MSMIENPDEYGMHVLQARSLRSLVEQANNKGIIKEEIVKVFHKDGEFFLLYYN